MAERTEAGSPISTGGAQRAVGGPSPYSPPTTASPWPDLGQLQRQTQPGQWRGQNRDGDNHNKQLESRGGSPCNDFTPSPPCATPASAISWPPAARPRGAMLLMAGRGCAAARGANNKTPGGQNNSLRWMHWRPDWPAIWPCVSSCKGCWCCAAKLAGPAQPGAALRGKASRARPQASQHPLARSGTPSKWNARERGTGSHNPGLEPYTAPEARSAALVRA